jgi:hypothetical protein
LCEHLEVIDERMRVLLAERAQMIMHVAAGQGQPNFLSLPECETAHEMLQQITHKDCTVTLGLALAY